MKDASSVSYVARFSFLPRYCSAHSEWSVRYQEWSEPFFFSSEWWASFLEAKSWEQVRSPYTYIVDGVQL
jgi:hypothetical protein